MSDCILWKWSTNSNGYGKINVAGKFIAAHRASYEAHVGPIPKGLWVLHHCDVPRCINPDHLFLGTVIDNARDCLAKGRWPSNPPRGEQHPSAKLTAQNVRAIRRLHAKGATCASLANRYGVSGTHIAYIVGRRSWGWLP